MTLTEFQAMPTVASHFPLVFDDGARWEVMTGHCADCNEKLPVDAFRGYVTRPFFTYRGNEGTFLLEAWGLCPECEVLTNFNWQLHPDLTLVGRDKTGEMAMWMPRRPWWSGVRKFMKGLF